MFKNYLKIAFRNLRNNKVYSFINIAGLAVGLASFILISTFIKNELNYDNFHENADRVYRAVGVFNRPGLGRVDNAVTPGPLAPAMAADFSQVASATRIRPLFTVFCKVGDKGFYESDIAMTDPAIFDIFTIPLRSGDPKTALSNPNSLVIDAELAQKYFGHEDPIGRTISLHSGSGAEDYTVTGVMEKYPENSHLAFSALASLVTIENQQSFLTNFNSNSVATYILLQEGVSKTEVEQQIPAFIDKHVPNKENIKLEKWYLQPLDDIHLRSGHLLYQTYNRRQGSINTVYLFSAIAVLVLLIASINFMNLSTARSAKRAKEVGLRKVVGSSRKQLIYQFIGESVLITFLALVLAFLLVQIAAPFFEELVAGRLIFAYHQSLPFILQVLGIAFVVGIVSGSYPAFFLSAYQPSETLKGSFSSGTKGARLRQVLVLSQFAIAITLIICTGVVSDQMDYIRSKDLGLNPDQVVYVPIRGKEARDNLTVLKNELKKNENILSVAASEGLRGAGGSNGLRRVAGTNGEVQMMLRFSAVDYDFIETMQIELVQGRNFSPEIAADTTTSIIINETVAKELAWENAIGKEFETGGGGPNMRVIGVVKDYHFFSLRSKIEPQMMYVNPRQYNYLLLKIRPQDASATLAFVEETWKKIAPGRPFEHGFLDENFARLYESEENAGKLFTAFAALAIFIACLGLFGLASFTAEQKTKEIGIRKVLGASVTGIVTLLSKTFIKWVAIASLFAFPFAYFIMQDWLANFVYRTSPQPLTFILATLIVIAIALVTVSVQAIKAALTNPVKALRYE